MSRMIVAIFVVGSVLEPHITKEFTTKGIYFINSAFRTIVNNYNSQQRISKEN